MRYLTLKVLNYKMSLYQMLISYSKQLLMPYPQSPACRNGAGEVSARGSHQWTWDEQPTQRQIIIFLARLQ